MDALTKIFQPKYYQEAIDVLEIRSMNQRQHLEQDGVNFFNFYFDKITIAKRIAKTVKTGCYQFTSVCAKKSGEHEYCITDRIVQLVIARVLLECCEKLTTPQVKGELSHKNILTLTKSCSSFLKQWQTTSSVTSGLFVWRGIIHDYPSCISVGAGSSLWDNLAEILCLHRPMEKIESLLWVLLQNAIRPVLLTDELAPFQTLTLANKNQFLDAAMDQIYLYHFDRYLSTLPGAFYMRCSGEFIFLHPDLEVIIAASSKALTILQQLNLMPSYQDISLNYFIGQPNVQWLNSGIKIVHSIRFFDFWINYDGSLAIEKKITSRLLRGLTKRAVATKNLLGNINQNELGKAICTTFNRIFAHDELLAGLKFQQILNTSDKKQLKELDDKIATIVAETVAQGDTQQIPYWKIRKQWHLRSLFDLIK